MKADYGLFTVRRAICKKCPTPCDQQHNSEFYGLACNACPLPKKRWGKHGDCHTNSVGLGDVVASVATPIARMLGLSCIDKQTNQLRPDSPCAKRKAALNSITLTS